MFRYIKLWDADPGERFDLFTWRTLFSPRFLNRDEHLLDGRLADAWATLWCLLLSLPRFLRTITLPFFAGIGICYVLATVYVFYQR